MSFLFDTPDPPNPFLTAAAQTGSNVSTAIANTFLGNVNQATPQGNLRYDVTDYYQWQDPATFQTYTIPRFTATQTLNPTAQSAQYYNDITKEQVSALGYEQAVRLRNQFATPMNGVSRFSPRASSKAGIASGGSCKSTSSGITAAPLLCSRPALSAVSLPKLRERRTIRMAGSSARRS